MLFIIGSFFSMGSGGFWWVLVGSGGFWWVLVGSGGFWWVLVGSGGFWWVLVGSGGFLVSESLRWVLTMIGEGRVPSIIIN